MKCLNKKVVARKHEFQGQREREAEEARWNSLTPEEQEKERAEKEERMKKAMKALSDLKRINSYINGPYGRR